MIAGVGTDIVQIARIKASWSRNGAAFAQKILGADEYREFQQRSAKSEERGVRYLATRFAAKEAFSKAMGCGFRAPMSWHGLQILNDDQGKPVIQLAETLHAWMAERQLQAQVSLSDELDYALAFVIFERV
ncbi:MAG: holo-ACP synthase [Burkholderiaceae bacterium]|nr:holo-ACP synthase [Burkholderiaceae bacterium]